MILPDLPGQKRGNFVANPLQITGNGAFEVDDRCLHSL
jgi:hypothetical protein